MPYTKIDYSRASKQSVLDRKYIQDISRISGLPISAVKKVFEVYNLYILHELAIAYKPKECIYISIPGFSTIRVTPTKGKQSKYGVQLHLTKGVKDTYKDKMQQALYSDVDYLDLWMQTEFCKLMVKQGYIHE